MQYNNIRTNKRKVAIVIAAVVVIAVLAGLVIARFIYLNQLRSDMDERVAAALNLIDGGEYKDALAAVQQALELATKLRDDEAITLNDTYITIIETVMHADTYFHDEKYHTALRTYQAALTLAIKTENFSTRYIDEMSATAEGYIEFYDTMQQADSFASSGEHEAALVLYIEAEQTAAAISFNDGQNQAAEGSRLMEEQIALAKWHAEMMLQAEAYIESGNLLLSNGDYALAIEEYQNAAEIYRELGEQVSVDRVASLISVAAQLLAEEAAAQAALPDDTGTGGGDVPDDTDSGNAGTGGTVPDSSESIYDYNLSIDFDLSTMIDSQKNEPASLIKMGIVDDRNEGWYNGCGWIAAYNVLIMLDDSRHPADIVQFFEASGGTVMSGVFGTYPHAIEDYFKSLGHSVSHTLFPQSRLNIDNAIKTAGSGILAYAHTSGAHYVAIEYRESDGRYVVYNDSTAKARSRNLELSDLAPVGAVIDSVESWLDNTPNILFAFSLITPDA